MARGMVDRTHEESEELGAAETMPGDELPTLNEASDTGSQLERSDLTGASREQDAELRKPGEQLGRFTIVELLGEGGMGRVYSAHDPELDRKAAIKEMRVHTEDPGAMARGQARLLREAQALAKLAHPNVVTVYEVGTVRDGVFVAMEYIEGQTLTAWLEGDRSWREIIQCFVGAGRGLAAGHDAGLVHRDFKPDNVLVGDDGRPRVIDFGLVRSTMEEEPQAEERRMEITSGSALDTPMTRTGAILGTPRFMSPEQHRGRRLDARSDQFSFCVALYAALYDEAPFEGDTLDSLADSVIEGRVRRPGRSSVPGRIAKALDRGLSPRADLRFGSMRELLYALTRPPLVTARRVATGGAIVAAASLALVMTSGNAAEPGARCRDFDRALVGVWDRNEMGKVSRAFQATGRPYALDTFRRVQTIVDDYAQRWVTARTDACEATHVRGEQSDTLMDQRMQCLDARLADLSAMVGLFSKRATARIVDKAVETAHDLPDLGPCSNADALTTLVPPPTDPAIRRRVRTTRKQLARLTIDLRSGKYKAGLPVAEIISKQAKDVGYLPLQSDALLTLALYQGKLGKHSLAETSLSTSVLLASRARDDRMVARAMVGLVSSVAKQGRADEAITLSSVAAAAIERASGDRDELRASLANNLGGLHYAKGRWTEARRELKRAADLRVQAHGEHDPRVAASFHNLGIVAKAQGKYAEAASYHKRALEIRETVFGKNHPQVASSLNSLGALAAAVGDYPAALAYHERALSIFKGLSATHPKVGHSLNNLGSLARAQGKYELALDYHRKAQALWKASYNKDHPLIAASLHNIGADYLALGKLTLARTNLEAALAMRKRLLGPTHAQVGMTLNELAGVIRRQGDPRKARTMYEETIAIWTKSLGPNHPNVAAVLINLGEGYRATGDCARATGKYRRALAISEKKFGQSHPFIAHALVGLGACSVDAGRAAPAIALIERAVVINEKMGQPEDLAVSRFQLARALWSSRRDRKRAVALAGEAQTVLSKSDKHKTERRTVARWLRGKK